MDYEETFKKRYKNCNSVIPAKAGIQLFQGLSGFTGPWHRPGVENYSV